MPPRLPTSPSSRTPRERERESEKDERERGGPAALTWERGGDPVHDVWTNGKLHFKTLD